MSHHPMRASRFPFLGFLRRNVRRRDRSRSSRAVRRLHFEALEGRRVLAATDLAAIGGMVFDDFTGNGYDPGEEVVGATVQLYRDDGDGVFEPATGDTLVGTDTTDAAGEYQFNDLTAASYFANQPAQTVGATTLLEYTSSLITISAAQAQGVLGTTVDSFDVTTQTVTDNSSAPPPGADTRAAPEALGGERDLYVNLTSATGTLSLDVNNITPLLLEFQASATATGDRVITWDGPDGDAATLAATGLGGVDLTNGGTDVAISLTIGADQANGAATIRVYTNATDFSESNAAIPNTGGTATDSIVIRFANFTVAGGAGADFTNVGAIQIRIEGIAAVDGQLDLVGALGPTVVTQNFNNFEQADLSVTKSVDNATPNVGNNVTFTVSVANAGPNAATNVSVSDTLPSGLTFVSGTPTQGTYTSGTGVWTVGSLNSGASATLPIVATVANAGTKTNTAQVSAADQFDPDSTPNNSVATEDDQASASVTPPVIDLSVTKSVDNAAPLVGSNVTFTVTVSNAGPDGATNVALSDPLPSGLTFVSSTASQGSYASGTGIWTVGSIANGGSATLQLVATVASSGTKTNTAQVSAADQTDSDSTPNNSVATEDDQASVSVTPPVIDLSVTKSVNNAAPLVGSNVTFTVTVSNAGPDGATNIALSDPLPSGLTFVSSTASQGSYASGTGIWTVGSIANGGNATLQIVATVASAGTKTNTAQVSAADQTDSDSTPNNSVATEDDQASASVTPPVIDLSVTKSVNNATPQVGSNVTFTVTVANAGPDGATNVALSDSLPSGLTIVSATASQGSFASGTGIWTVGSIANGGNATLQLVATVANSGTKTNTAQVSAADQTDSDSTPNNSLATEDDQASASVTPQVVDLSLTKTVNNSSPTIGSTVIFTVAVSNAGPDQATNVTVGDTLPSGTTFVSSTASQGSYASGTGVWTVGTIANGGSATLQVSATVDSRGAKTNTAQVRSVDQFDSDSTPNNSVASEDDQASATVEPPRNLSKRLFLAR